MLSEVRVNYTREKSHGASSYLSGGRVSKNYENSEKKSIFFFDLTKFFGIEKIIQAYSYITITFILAQVYYPIQAM